MDRGDTGLKEARMGLSHRTGRPCETGISAGGKAESPTTYIAAYPSMTAIRYRK